MTRSRDFLPQITVATFSLKQQCFFDLSATVHEISVTPKILDVGNSEHSTAFTALANAIANVNRKLNFTDNYGYS